jgi:hypothetical protein
MPPTSLLLLHSLRSKGYTAKIVVHVTSALCDFVLQAGWNVATKQQK